MFQNILLKFIFKNIIIDFRRQRISDYQHISPARLVIRVFFKDLVVEIYGFKVQNIHANQSYFWRVFFSGQSIFLIFKKSLIFGHKKPLERIKRQLTV